MYGDAIKYEPIWQSREKKLLLKHTGVNDCLKSATAGLTQKSISKVKNAKRQNLQTTQSRASSGALHMEDVGLMSRHSGKIRSASRSNTRRRQEEMASS